MTDDSEIRRFADLLLLQNLPYRGAQVLETAIANDSVTLDEELYEKLANCWLAAGELERAIEPLTRAAELSTRVTPSFESARCNLQRQNWAARRTTR